MAQLQEEVQYEGLCPERWLAPRPHQDSLRQSAGRSARQIEKLGGLLNRHCPFPQIFFLSIIEEWRKSLIDTLIVIVHEIYLRLREDFADDGARVDVAEGQYVKLVEAVVFRLDYLNDVFGADAVFVFDVDARLVGNNHSRHECHSIVD